MRTYFVKKMHACACQNPALGTRKRVLTMLPAGGDLKNPLSEGCTYYIVWPLKAVCSEPGTGLKPAPP